MKKQLFTVMLVMLLLVCGCGAKEKTETAEPSETGTPAPAEDVVICKVNDVSILRSEYEPMFHSYYNMYTSYGVDFSNEEELKALQEFVFQILLDAEIRNQKARSLNITITDEQRRALVEQVQAEYDALVAGYVAQAEAEGAADAQARGREMLDEAVIASGYVPEEFYELFMGDVALYEKQQIWELLEAHVCADITYDQTQADEDFAADLEYYRTRYAETPALFADDYAAYQAGTASMPLYTPEGYRRVKHILVADETLAKELLVRARAGEDFDALMAEYGTDPGMQSEPNKSTGYLTSASTNFVPEFLAASMALENVGDISEIVPTTHGYHIIKLESLLVSGGIDFEEIKEEYVAQMALTRRQQYYSEQTALWLEEAEVVSYIGRIRDLGK